MNEIIGSGVIMHVVPAVHGLIPMAAMTMFASFWGGLLKAILIYIITYLL